MFDDMSCARLFRDKEKLGVRFVEIHGFFVGRGGEVACEVLHEFVDGAVGSFGFLLE